MKHGHRLVAALAALALTVAPLAACGGSDGDGGGEATEGTGLTVAASLVQWGSVATRIGGDDVSVTSVITNSSVSSHDYEPTAADIDALTSADIAIVNGAGYDAWATDALASDSDTTVINVADLAGVKEGDNPHLWFSVDAIDKTAQAVHDALAEKDAAHSGDFDANLESWDAAEERLEKNMEIIRSSISGNTYVATESVAQYLLDDLGLVDETPQGYKNAAANDSEPSAADLDEVTAMIRNKEVGMLVVNDQESSDASDALYQAAQDAQISVFHVTESMTEDASNVLEWVYGLSNSLILIAPTARPVASGSASASAD